MKERHVLIILFIIYGILCGGAAFVFFKISIRFFSDIKFVESWIIKLLLFLGGGALVLFGTGFILAIFIIYELIRIKNK